MSTLKNIKDGFTNYMKAAKPDSIVDPEVEKVAQERAEICKECPELEQSGFFRMVNKIINIGGKDVSKNILNKLPTKVASNGEEYKDAQPAYRCGQCGCSFPQNVYAPKKECPLGKW